MKLPIFTRPLYGISERNTKSFFFSFFKLRYGSFEFNRENFANIWQIKWNWIRSMKFETVRIYFLSELSVCCHLKLLLPWQRDVTTSPLCCKTNTQVRGIPKMPLLQNIQFYFQGKIPNNLCFQKNILSAKKKHLGRRLQNAARVFSPFSWKMAKVWTGLDGKAARIYGAIQRRL